MYMCRDCEATFDEPKAILFREPHNEVAEMGIVPYEVFSEDFCPECGSNHFEEATQCPVCGEWHTDDYSLCIDCRVELSEKLEALRLKYGLSPDQYSDAVDDYFKMMGW